MRLREIEKLKKRGLRQRVDEAFEKADEKGPGYLMEAQFYMRELEHRRDSWVSIRDLVLEIVVIALIGWEIWMGYRAERLQTQNFDKEQQVFTNLQASSAATAKTLESERQTMEAMKVSLQRQVELFYDVQINVVYNEATKKLLLINNGRTNVMLYEAMIGGDHTEVKKFEKPQLITPAGAQEFAMEKAVEDLAKELPKGQERTFTFTFFVKNEKQERFTLAGDLAAVWRGDVISFNTHPSTIVPGWKK
jgi:hypothetical protein